MDDMIIPVDVEKALFEPSEGRRNAVKDMNILWPDKTVRWMVSDEYTEADVHKIKRAISMITSKSCVKFQQLFEPPNDGKPFVFIESISGCYATVGSDCDYNECEMSLMRPVGIIGRVF